MDPICEVQPWIETQCIIPDRYVGRTLVRSLNLFFADDIDSKTGGWPPDSDMKLSMSRHDEGGVATGLRMIFLGALDRSNAYLSGEYTYQGKGETWAYISSL